MQGLSQALPEPTPGAVDGYQCRSLTKGFNFRGTLPDQCSAPPFSNHGPLMSFRLPFWIKVLPGGRNGGGLYLQNTQSHSLCNLCPRLIYRPAVSQNETPVHLNPRNNYFSLPSFDFYPFDMQPVAFIITVFSLFAFRQFFLLLYLIP